MKSDIQSTKGSEPVGVLDGLDMEVGTTMDWETIDFKGTCHDRFLSPWSC